MPRPRTSPPHGPAGTSGDRSIAPSPGGSEDRDPAEASPPDESLFRTLVEDSIAGIAVISQERRIVFANRSFAQIFGYAAPSECLGRSAVDFIAPHERERLTGQFLARLRGEPAANRYEYEGLRKDGSPVWIDRLTTRIDWKGAPAIQATFIDISDRKHAQAELLEKRRLFDIILDALPVGLHVVDEHLRFVSYNRQALRMNDLPQEFATPGTRFEAVIRYNAERGEYGPGDPEEQTRTRVELAAQFLPHHLERQRPDGRWLEIQGNTIPGGGFIAVTSDVTERKRMERALADSEHLLQTVFDSLPHWISVKDLAGRYLLGNRRMLEDLGLDREALRQLDVLGLPTADPHDFADRLEHDRIVVETGEPVELPENAVHLPDGRVLLLQSTKLPLRNATGGITGIVTIARDVTAHRLVERTLRQFKSTLDRTLDCVFMFDPETLRYVYVNRGAREQVDFSEDELLRMTPVDLTPEFDEREFRALIAPLRSGERLSLTVETVHRTQSGAEIPVEVFLQHVEVESGAPRYVAIVRDISERRHLEEQLRQSQKMEAVGTLAGGIAHDFNNALVPIVGYTNLLQARVAPGSKEEHWLEVISQAAQRARDLVARILLYSRQSETRRQTVRLDVIAREVEQFLRSSLPTSLTIVAQVAADSWGHADSVQIHQVLMNLCINASQAMPEGGTLRIDLHDVHADDLECYLGQRIAGHYHRLSIADTGIGMDADTLGHIFEPFFTTKGVGIGTGLGLSTVLGIVQSHEGTLRVESEPGAGSRFEVYLPVAPAPQPAADNAAEGPLNGRERILLVDDEPAIVEMLEAVLGDLGYRVTCHSDSRAAMELLEADPAAFDLVITDLTMPHLTGDRLAARLRALNGQVPIILCTGFGNDDLPQGTNESAITVIIRKPYRTNEIATAIRRQLDASLPPTEAGGASAGIPAHRAVAPGPDS